MKTLKDGTNVRAIMWYIALEYKDYLLQNNETPPILLEMNKEDFEVFFKKASDFFLAEFQNN